MSGSSAPRLGVLMVTGAYFPELSGGGLQCKAIIDALRTEVRFAVLTTSTDAALPAADTIDGTPVRRVYIDVSSRWSRIKAAWTMITSFAGLASSCDVVHLHGFSQKSILVVLLAKAFNKRIVLTLHTAGQDEPGSVRRQGRLAPFELVSGIVSFSYVPVLHATAVAIAIRLVAPEVRFARAFALYAEGYGPWFLFMLAIAGGYLSWWLAPIWRSGPAC